MQLLWPHLHWAPACAYNVHHMLVLGWFNKYTVQARQSCRQWVQWHQSKANEARRETARAADCRV